MGFHHILSMIIKDLSQEKLDLTMLNSPSRDSHGSHVDSHVEAS